MKVEMVPHGYYQVLALAPSGEAATMAYTVPGPTMAKHRTPEEPQCKEQALRYW
jgi:hypothetical protein